MAMRRIDNVGHINGLHRARSEPRFSNPDLDAVQALYRDEARDPYPGSNALDSDRSMQPSHRYTDLSGNEPHHQRARCFGFVYEAWQFASLRL